MYILFFIKIFSDISYSIASLTDNEARRYGRFLLGLLETVMHWHSDIEIFEKECSHYPGFLTVFRNSLNNSYTAPNKQEQLDYENFRHVCHKWHYKLTKSFIVCLESEEYLQMRNALIILTKILPHYPKLSGFCSALEKRVEKIKQNEKDKRQDIYTLASVYLGQLRQRKPQMLEESKFHLKEVAKDKVAKSSPISYNFDKPVAGVQSSQLTTNPDEKLKQTQKPSSNIISTTNGNKTLNQLDTNKQTTTSTGNSNPSNNISSNTSANNKYQANNTQSGTQVISSKSNQLPDSNKNPKQQNDPKTITL
jgi:THO complex subunit 2